MLRCHRRRCGRGNDDIDAETNQLSGEVRQALRSTFREAILEGDVLPLDPSQLA